MTGATSPSGWGRKPARLRTLAQLQFDRRNQIAHEGDWDAIAVDFRACLDAHVNDCIGNLDGIVSQLEALIP